MKPIKLSANEAARQLRISTDTLTRNFKAVGIEVGKGKRFTLAEIFRAVSGDLKFERARHERALADRTETRNKVESGELVPWENVEAYLTQRLINPVITALDSCPPEAEEWKTKTLLPAIRINLQLPKT